MPASTFEALRLIEPVRSGDEGYREAKRILPAPPAHVDAVPPFLTHPVAAIVQNLWLTGARCSEVTALRPIDIDTNGAILTAELARHKMKNRGKTRMLALSPRSQRVLKPFLIRDVSEPLFSPAEGIADHLAVKHARRKTPLRHGNRPGTNRCVDPKKRPGRTYSTGTVRHSIARACESSLVPVWTPHQLRHLAATEIRCQYGLEAAALVLGHASATLTDRVYAERDAAKVVDVMRKLG
ncbi:MAG: site-specific integrase [Planctomycetota bacterium]